MNLKIKRLDPHVDLPVRMTAGSAGFDIHWSESTCTLEPGKQYEIDLGFSTEFPSKHAAIIMPRSGLGSKYGLKLVNTLGLIDSDYRGQWKAVITVDKSLRLVHNERFLQFTFVTVPEVTVEETNETTDTVRGSGGFGHTGN